MAESGSARVIIFACNWNAYECLEEIGKQHLNYPPEARTLRVDCLGQIGPSMILKALEKGANGVMLVGCAPEECHYEVGSRRAEELFQEVRRLTMLLGFRDDQLAFLQVRAGEGAALLEKIRAFTTQIENCEQR
jgi:coenzyme F420-reducing hydrogenase delta subunit